MTIKNNILRALLAVFLTLATGVSPAVLRAQELSLIHI